jgi:phenylacetate-CoA oxygenase PaaI subunit
MQETAAAGSAEDLEGGARRATRDLILVLADSKRMLGTRYAGWILGAPELEAGIACASMAQDEWGHGRLLYSLLKEFGEDVDRLEHGREAEEYRSMEALDRAPESWAGLVAMNALVDTALSIQLEALRGSSHAMLRQRVEKILDEERFHAAHGVAWFRRMAGATPESKAELVAEVTHVLPLLLSWFGPDSEHARSLHDAGVTDAVGSGLRTRFIERTAPLLGLVRSSDVADAVEPDFSNFDEVARRTEGASPDAETIARVRGDKNRAFLMD